MRLLFVIGIILLPVFAFANTYSACSVDNVVTTESVQNIAVVTLNCAAPDAMPSGSNCSVTPRNNAFLFDLSTANGKGNLSLLLIALSAGNTITATTYGYCIPAVSDTLALYSLKLSKK